MKKNIKTRSNIVRKRSQGFLAKMATKDGRSTINRRRRKGRKRLCI